MVSIIQKYKWQPTPVFLSGKFHGQRRLAGYSPRSHKESDMTGQLTLDIIRINYSETNITV